MAKQYETVIGLEVHIELATKTKIFCGCSTEFGGAPNTHTCPVCTGMPGSLPVLNKQVVEYAMAIGLATNCKITQVCKFDRKNYFYPDNPQNYQISQLYLPIARDGYVEIESGSGKKKVRIHEMHMEEDAGKLVHDEWDDTSLVDYNRSGVPLVEIVSEPDMRSAEEVISYLEKLRMIVQYLGATDCKLQEGSMRADVNLSVREVGSDQFGTRTEMKNLNSFKAIAHAIEGERQRQIELIEEGKQVVAETNQDPYAKTFAEYVQANLSTFSGKKVYVLCNSGQRGARAATALLADNGVDPNTIYTITGGAGDKTVQSAFVTVDGYKFVSGTDAIAAAKDGSAYIIDVRSSKAQTKTGTLKGSISQSLFDDNNKLDTAEAEALEKAFIKEIPSKITEDKPIYIICNSGARGAQKATLLLSKLGYNTSIKEDGKVYTIENGAKGLELLYAMSGTDGNAVDGKTAVAAVGKDDVVILDVRATGNYGSGHLKGSMSTPVFNANGVAKTTDDQLSKDFTKYVTDNKATLEKKELYLLCNSGASGARAATALLKSAGYDLAKVHTITGGAKDADVKAAAIYVSDTHVINKMADTKNYLILDVRSTASYTKGHLKGSLSLPLFDKDNKLPDDLAKAFTEYVTAHKADFEGKTIYVLCNSGARGAAKATQLLKEAGITNIEVFTIENGAKSEVIQKHFVTDPVADPDTKKDNNGKDNNKNQNNGKTTTAATTKTGDTAPIAALAVAMLAALGAIIAFGKKKIVK